MGAGEGSATITTSNTSAFGTAAVGNTAFGATAFGTTAFGAAAFFDATAFGINIAFGAAVFFGATAFGATAFGNTALGLTAFGSRSSAFGTAAAFGLLQMRGAGLLRAAVVAAGLADVLRAAIAVGNSYTQAPGFDSKLLLKEIVKNGINQCLLLELTTATVRMWS